MELGLATFADLASGVSPEQRMRELMEEAELADQLGLDVFAVGEHHRPASGPVAINTHAFVGTTLAQAGGAFAQPYLAMMNRIGRERGWPPASAPQYKALRAPNGALAVGSPEQVAEKLLFEHELFGHDRYIAQMSVGAVAHADVLRPMELFGTQVAPVVRAEVARRGEATRESSQPTGLRALG